MIEYLLLTNALYEFVVVFSIIYLGSMMNVKTKTQTKSNVFYLFFEIIK